jgi:TrbL/VirB6 plasmid conjugal transfer protein
MPALPDPSQWVKDLFPQAVAAMLSALTFGLFDFVRQLLEPESPINFVSRTPPGLSYDSPTVVTFWGATRSIANAALAAVVVWGGLNAMARTYFRSTYHDVMELLPRVLLGAVLANTSRDWCRLAIDFNNAFSDAIGNVTPPGFDQAPGVGQGLINVVAGLIYVVMGLLLGLQMLMRLGLVDLLIVVAPLAMLCWVLPQTQAWAHQWSVLFTTAVFVQGLQVLGLKLGVSLASELPAMAEGTTAQIVHSFLGIAILALVLKLPGFMPGPSRGSGGVMTLVEGAAIGRVLGLAGGVGGRASAGGRASGSAGRAAAGGGRP